jgi:sulfur-oxidizing protein SoxZ
MAVSTLISFPATAKPGEVIEIRASIRHPMETGYRRGSAGAMLPRDLIRKFTCHLEIAGVREQIFSAELFAAITANPFVAFHLRATESGVLVFAWEGDNGFAQSARVPLTVR